MLYVGMTRVKSHIIRIQNASKMPPNSVRKPSQDLKLTRSCFQADIYLSICPKLSYVPPVLCARIRSPAISQIRVIIFFLFFFSKPAISIPEAVDVLIFLLNISRVGKGVHAPLSDCFFLAPCLYAIATKLAL